jgi:hypothetical protein
MLENLHSMNRNESDNPYILEFFIIRNGKRIDLKNPVSFSQDEGDERESALPEPRDGLS